MSRTGSEQPAVEIRQLVKGFTQPGARRSPSTRRWTSGWGRPKVSRLALDHVNLSVRRGETLGIIGLNGSGKSTLVRVLATLTVPDSGSAHVFGEDVVADAPMVRRLINRVSVEAAFFKEMSPWENLQYAARLYGRGSPASRSEAERILARLGLPRSAMDRPMKGLSRGQQQKVAIARSFMSSPSLLLMDEPTTGLDPRSRREVQDFVRTIRREQGATVLLCTHDLLEAEQLCDRVIVLDRGRILAEGTPAELCARHPVNNRATSLEDVFLHLSGKSFDEDTEEEVGEDEQEEENSP